jgi:hypothetical protein
LFKSIDNNFVAANRVRYTIALSKKMALRGAGMLARNAKGYVSWSTYLSSKIDDG